MRHKQMDSAVVLAVSTAILACDAGQTMAVADRGWPGDLREGNMLLGDRPSVGALAAYNAGVAALNAAAWLKIPERYDWILPLALGAFEMALVSKNMIATPRPFCGIR